MPGCAMLCGSRLIIKSKEKNKNKKIKKTG